VFSLPDPRPCVQEAGCACELCLAEQLSPEEASTLYAAVAACCSPLDGWLPLSPQHRRVTLALVALGLLVPDPDPTNAEVYLFTPLGFAVAATRLLLYEATLARLMAAGAVAGGALATHLN
jgi:hypothetical protein